MADLVVGDDDRSRGCVGLIVLGPDLRMAQPCIVGDVDDGVEPEEGEPPEHPVARPSRRV